MDENNGSLPDPPISKDIDLRDLCSYMPLKVSHLLDSETWAMSTGDEAKAALTLWCKSWHQVPAGSLPNNDKILAIWSGAGENWSRVKRVALRGFALHSDGKLYHRTVVERAIEAWNSIKKRSDAGAIGARIRWKDKKKLPNANALRSHQRTHSERNTNRREGKEREVPKERPPTEVQRKGTRLSPDWQPCAEDLAYAQKLGIEPPTENFRDYWIAKTGEKAVKLDWCATWRMWCRREAERKLVSPNGSNGGWRPPPSAAGG